MHVHDCRRDGFHRAKRPRGQANADEDDEQDDCENDFPAARGGWGFWLGGFRAAMLKRNRGQARIEKIVIKIEIPSPGELIAR